MDQAPYQIPFGYPDLVSNPEPRCPCLLLLDTSSSMAGEAIAELNAGLQSFKRDLQSDELAMQRVELAIITFGPVQIHAEFRTADGFEPPLLHANGDTPMGAAIMRGLDMLESRKKDYKQAGISYFRPWVFLITDGGPTDEWRTAAQRVHAGEQTKAFSFFAVGVHGANMQTLGQICSASRQPLSLNGLRFCELFKWLSSSLGGVAKSRPGDRVALPTPSGWASV
jgi:uncharacterized protein YegL